MLTRFRVPAALSPLRLPGSIAASVTPATHPVNVSLGATLQQVRYGPKDGRPGRLQHHIFGCDKAKGRYYYRFHKLIGKWNWRKYIERYMAPRAIENRQRWIPTTFANYVQMRASHAWYWLLPKELAAATTSDQVLESWIKYRHKHPKKTFHYFKVLRRLCEVGGCDAGDWRLRFITSRLRPIHRQVLNKPRLAKYYAELRIIDGLEDLSRFLMPMLPKYPPQQLILTVHAYGLAQLQDKHLFAQVSKHLAPQLAGVTPTDLVRLAEAFAAVDICHYTLLTQLSAQLQVRVQQASEGQAPPWTCPTFDQLTLIASAFAHLKFQDYSYFEMCAEQADVMLHSGLQGSTPTALARLCSSCGRLKIHEVRFFELILAHIFQHWYDYPAASLAEIGAVVAPVLPKESARTCEAFKIMMHTIATDVDTLALRDIGLAARFMAELDHKGEFYSGFQRVLSKRVVDLRDDTKNLYDVARAIEIFSRRCPQDNVLFSTLCRHIHRHLAKFEPVDFLRVARGLTAVTYRDDRVVHALAKWAAKRAAEFSSHDWEAFVSAVGVLKGSQAKLMQDRLRQSASLLLDPSTTTAAVVQARA